MSRMTELHYRLSFNTPAFLGNAQQQAQWRTPPIKALIRQWWRIVKAPLLNYETRRLLEAENCLFGSAGTMEKSGQSLVRLRMSSWASGDMPSVPRGDSLPHREVAAPIGANLYLGYGPIGGVARTAISATADVSTQLSLRMPENFANEIKAAIQLAHWFGAVGSRSRNGFGSVAFEGEEISGFAGITSSALAQIAPICRLNAALTRDWPHALGGEADPFVWRLLRLAPNATTGKTEQLGFARWEDAMLELARIKIAVRTAAFFKFEGGGRDGHATAQPRHLLSYPSGSAHAVKDWGRDGRLANQVRFKVHRRAAKDFVAVVAHFPCGLPKPLADKLRGRVPDQSAVWSEVHRLLDQQQNNGLTRLKGSPT